MNYRLDRYELKFLVSAAQQASLLPVLLPHLVADEYAGEGAFYPIVSLYYDNSQRECYWENIDGAQSRRKLRVRVYGSLDGALPPSCFAEVKHKVDGRNVKRRARLSLEQALTVAAGGEIPAPATAGEARTIEEIRALVRQRQYAPCCCLRYDRQAFIGQNGEADLRITFDTGIAYRFDNLRPTPDDRDFRHYLHAEDFAVMEVKVTGAVPYWLARLLGEHGCGVQSHSKYCRALEAGDPVLRQRLGDRLPPVGAHAHAARLGAASLFSSTPSHPFLHGLSR